MNTVNLASSNGEVSTNDSNISRAQSQSLLIPLPIWVTKDTTTSYNNKRTWNN